MQKLLDDRRVLFPVLLAAVAIALGSVLIVVLGGDSSGGASTTPASAGPAASQPSAPKGAATVDIADFMFEPAVVTVTAGSKVTWVNRDSAPHTATAGDVFDTGTLKKGAKKTLTFDTPGTYAYICDFHPFMKATVIVT